MRAIFFWREHTKKGKNEWYESKPCLFILHNQLNIIICPFKSAEIKDQQEMIKVTAFCLSTNPFLLLCPALQQVHWCCFTRDLTKWQKSSKLLCRTICIDIVSWKITLACLFVFLLEHLHESLGNKMTKSAQNKRYQLLAWLHLSWSQPG